MNKKKGLKVFLLTISLLVLITFILPFIQAQYYGSGGGFSFPFIIDLGEGMRQILDQIVGFLTPVFQVVLGDYSYNGFFFSKVLILILLIVIIYFILDHVHLFQGYRTISMLVSLIISIISVRFMSENDFFTFILLPYGALGIAITTLLPFFIFAYGIHTTGMPGIARKVSWFFFGMVFIGLWLYQFDKISPLGNYIYMFTIVAGIFMFFFDRTVHAYFRGMDIKRFEEQSNENEINTLQGRLRYLIDFGGPNPSQTNLNERRRIIARLRKLGATINSSNY